MPEITLKYRNNDTTLDRLERKAAEHGVTPEILAKRLISEGLGNYGLKELSEEEQKSVSSLSDLLEKTGLQKN